MTHSLRRGRHATLRFWIGILVMPLMLSACQTTDGGDFMTQDFANYGKNYRPIEIYLLTPGNSESEVKAKLAAKHKVVRDESIEGKRLTTWMYEKWRASLGPDQIETRTFLHFAEGKLVNWNRSGDNSKALSRLKEPVFVSAQPSAPAPAPVVALTPATSARLAKHAAASGRRGQPHALLIGNNDYRHLGDLMTAVNDAEVVGKLLREEYGFRTQVLLNATRAQILDAFDRYRKVLKEGDDLMIYYAGHGWLDSKVERGYWLPVDAKTGSRSDWLSNADITDTLKALRSRHVIVIADSCYSGTLTRSAARGIQLDTKSEDFVERLLSKKSRTVLASGSLEPVLDGGGGKHSIFAKAFISVLRDNKAAIDGTNLYVAVRSEVALNAQQIPQYQNIRFAGHETGGDFVFIKSDAKR
ncbi:MAG: caspase family protein [Rhodospirillaceae bacterium]|nr:caspase family protein [Rhodospirillaceae bacterium]